MAKGSKIKVIIIAIAILKLYYYVKYIKIQLMNYFRFSPSLFVLVMIK